MQRQADKKCTEQQFTLGDYVFLLRLYVQQSVTQRTSHKLSFKFFEPYQVMQKMGAVAYKLQPSPSSHIHPVIHVSQLKKALCLSE